jgi:YHS domain-containing protein
VLRFALGALLIVMLARVIWKMVDGVIEGATGRRRTPRQGGTPTKLVRDPVCGTYIVPNPSLSIVKAGTTAFFCSDRCRESYRTR